MRRRRCCRSSSLCCRPTHASRLAIDAVYIGVPTSVARMCNIPLSTNAAKLLSVTPNTSKLLGGFGAPFAAANAAAMVLEVEERVQIQVLGHPTIGMVGSATLHRPARFMLAFGMVEHGRTWLSCSDVLCCVPIRTATFHVDGRVEPIPVYICTYVCHALSVRTASCTLTTLREASITTNATYRHGGWTVCCTSSR